MAKAITLEIWPFRAFSPVLPVVLLRHAKKRSYVWNRIFLPLLVGVAIVAVLIWFDSKGQTSLLNVPSIARFLFAALVVIQLYFIVIVAGMVGRDMVKEYETKRIDFLLCTRLSDFEIVLSKYLAALLPMVYAILSILPIASCLAYYANIGLSSLALVEVGVLVCLASSSSIGLYLAIRFPRMKLSQALIAYLVITPGFLLLAQGAFWTLIVTFMLAASARGLPPFRNPLLAGISHLDWIVGVLTLHPFGMVIPMSEMILQPTMWRLAHPRELLVGAVVTQLLIALLFLWLAARRLRRSVAGPPVVKATWRQRVQQFTWRWRPSVWEDQPILWKDLFTGRQLAFSVFLAILVWSAAMIALSLTVELVNSLGYVYLAAFPLLIAVFASLGFSREAIATERRSHTYDLLLMSLQEPRAILRQKLFAALGPAVTLAALAIPGLVFAAIHAKVPWTILVEYALEASCLLALLLVCGVRLGIESKAKGEASNTELRLVGIVLLYAALFAVLGILLVGVYLYATDGWGPTQANLAGRAILPPLGWIFHFSDPRLQTLDGLAALPGLLLYVWLTRRLLRDAEMRIERRDDA